MREVAERVFPRSDVRFKKTGDKVTVILARFLKELQRETRG